MSTFSESSVPKMRFDASDSVYRQLYTTLAITLMLDPKLALQIMAMWMWMEKSGFIDTIEKIQNLPLDLISGLADEAILCINYFKKFLYPTASELINSIPLLHFLMKKELTLMFLPKNRAAAIDGMRKVLNDAFVDFEILYNEAKMLHDTVNQKLADEEMAQITKSFNANINLYDDVATIGACNSKLSSPPGRIGFGLGSSSLFQQQGSSSLEPCKFNVGRSKSWNAGPSHQVSSPRHNAASFGPDPIKMVVPGSPVSPHGYVGMGRSNRGPDSPVLASLRTKPDVGVIGIGQPHLARSNSFHYEPTTPRVTPSHNVGSPGHLIPARVGPLALNPPHRFLPAPVEQRTLFATFSKGYRVYEDELWEYITALFGECIEYIIMQGTVRDEQPLYARIVFYSPETIEAILKGEERFKFSIKGKHVWVRKYERNHQKNKPKFESDF